MANGLRKITSHYLLTPQGLRRGVVLTLAADGTVISLDSPEHVDTQEGVEFFSGIIAPGFVNAHCHLELSHMRGLIPRGGGFRGFAEGMGRERNTATEEERSAAAAYHDSRMRAEGIIAVGDISNGVGTIPTKRSGNIHYHTFVELFGLQATDAGPIAGTIARFREAGLPCSATPHSTYSLNTAAFDAAVRHDERNHSNGSFTQRANASGVITGTSTYHTDTSESPLDGTSCSNDDTDIYRTTIEHKDTASKNGISPGQAATCSGAPANARRPTADTDYVTVPVPPLSIHFMESEAERQLYGRKGHLWEWYGQTGRKTDFLHYGSPAARLTAQVPAGRKVLLVHNTFISQEDIDTLNTSLSPEDITYVLCPRSNMYIENTMPDAALLRRSGSNIAVGTDSLASNDSLSVMEELKTFRGIPLEELLGWATLGGARALGIDAWAGSFSPGKRPGVTLIEGIDWDTMSLLPSAVSRKLM